MRPEQETIKLCYTTNRQQTVARINYAFDAEPYCATSIANILIEAFCFVGIKLGVVPLLLRNLIAMHLQEHGEDLSYSHELLGYNSTKTDEINKHMLTKDIGLIRNLLDDILAATQNCCSFRSSLVGKNNSLFR